LYDRTVHLVVASRATIAPSGILPFVSRLEPEPPATDDDDDGPSSTARCTLRDSGDDFFCQRYQLWYPSIDCAIRTRYRTSGGCANCDQGRFNLKRHASTLHRLHDKLSRAFRE
jgi:hypothetical protein